MLYYVNKDKSKTLLFNVEGRNIYLIPGGKVAQKETSIDAIKREIKEELGFEISDLSLLAVSEEFVNDKGYYNQQINFIYQGTYNETITKAKFKGLEGEWINFEWVDINPLDNYRVYPTSLKEIINNRKKVHHVVEPIVK